MLFYISTLFIFLQPTLAEECGYVLCPPTKEDHINVHIIPHTHDDVGWLKNIDQYYFGDANWYQTAGVQYILDSVIHALSINPSRKFTYVEMAYFERWWRLQNTAMQELVHLLVRNGQLEFALGGWTMNDEAVVHYSDSIDQLTRGLAFLNSTFGECGRPRVAWQIDPFGHAREQARIFMDAGFDGVFFQRMDYREKRRRLMNKEMEVMWKADLTDNATGLFTHMLYQSYCSPPGFCFDSKCDDPPMIVDPLATNFNVPSRVSQFLDYVNTVAKSYATNHIFVPMGCDFTYGNANENFINLDRLIEHVNAHQRRELRRATLWKSRSLPVNLLYSSPTCYTKAVNEAFNKKGMVPQREGDFFPYASAPNTFWTGYYTSRPSQKFMIRQASTLLAACEQRVILPRNLLLYRSCARSLLAGSSRGSTSSLSDSTGPHETGVVELFLTAGRRPDVWDRTSYFTLPLFGIDESFENDILISPLFRNASNEFVDSLKVHLIKPNIGYRYKYPSRMSYEPQRGVYLDSDHVVDELRRMMGVMQHHDAVTGTEKQHVSDDYRQRLTDAMKGCKQLISSVADTLLGHRTNSGGNGFRACDHLNVSVCPPLTSKHNLPNALIAIYNPLGWNGVQPWLRLPVHSSKEHADDMVTYTLTEYFSGETVASQLVSLSPAISKLPERRLLDNKGHSELVFKPATGLTPAGFTIFALKGVKSFGHGPSQQHRRRERRISLEIDENNLPVFRTQEGQNVTMILLNYDAESYYKPTSGAYVFRPLNNAVPFGKATSKMFDGELVKEVRTEFTPWAFLTARLYADDQMEVEWVVGPLPNIGRRVTEVVIRYRVSGTGVLPATEGEFYTDSMGNDLIRRERKSSARRVGYPGDTKDISDYNDHGCCSWPWWKRQSRDTTQMHHIEGNYFPVVNRILLKGIRYAFGVYTDRPEGGSSLAEGEVELMLHRATVTDDGLGVGEPLTERAFGEGVVVKGTHRLLFDTVDKVDQMDGRMAQEVSRPPTWVFRDYAKESLPPVPASIPSLLTRALPEGLHLLTAQQWPVEGQPSRNQLLARLQHIGTPGIGTITLELSDAFSLGNVVKTTEVSVIANQLAEEAQRKKLVWPSKYKARWNVGNPKRDNTTRIIIHPGEVKTFILDLA